MTFLGRDAIEIDALRTDRYLEALLAGGESAAAERTPTTHGVDPALAAAAERLGRDLVRVHPSFRFEERLARRLADIAAGMGVSIAAGAEGVVLPVTPFPFDPTLDPAADPRGADGGPALPLPVLIGGAVASAALSLAGAAFVAWRLGRPGTDPMTRAVRAAHQLRDVARPVRLRLD